MTLTNKEFFQDAAEEIRILILMDPNRGQRKGDGTGTQTRFRVYRKDSLKKTIIPPYYIPRGQEEKECIRLVKIYGTARIVRPWGKNEVGKEKHDSTILRSEVKTGEK